MSDDMWNGHFTDVVKDETPIALHTSDRIAFKRCRRKWGFSSPLRENLEPISAEQKIHLWFGSGFHFALEDFHGYRIFGYPEEAFEAYVSVFKPEELPPGAEDMVELGLGMLGYYQRWLTRRNEFTTLWLEGIPQVEVSFDLELKELSEIAGQPVYFHGTLDRIAVDTYGRWYVEDYKTAAAIDMDKLSTDPQISNYLWAAEQFFQHEFEGMIYTQYLKDFPSTPREVRGGFSQDKRQKTAHSVYRESLIQRYGKVPQEYISFLNDLAAQETPEGDRYIRRDIVRRNDQEKIHTYYDMVGEGMEMLNSNLYLYPNPTRDCKWDCSFRSVCLAMNDGSDYQWMLDTDFKVRNQTAKGEITEWEKRLNKLMEDRKTQKSQEQLILETPIQE